MFKRFLVLVDVLVSSRVPVDLLHDDFASFYEQFALGESQKWFNNQIVGEHGVDQGRRCRFGVKTYPDDTNETNFVVCDIIDQDALTLQEEVFQHAVSPWSPQMIQDCRDFLAIRRLVEGVARAYAQFPWFDDNAAAVLRPFTVPFKNLRYRTWARLNWEVSLPKAAISWWHQRQFFEAIVGFEVQPRVRRWFLPEDKVARYTAAIAQVQDDARNHPRSFVDRDLVLSLIGKISSATGPIPRIWRYFGTLITLIGCQHFDTWVLVHPQIISLLSSIRCTMETQTGQPLTSYHLRPGEDGLRIWQNFNDASRREETFFGAVGGWFRLIDSLVVFYFTHEWPVAHVERCNIVELEMQAAHIAQHLQLSIQRHRFGDEAHFGTGG